MPGEVFLWEVMTAACCRCLSCAKGSFFIAFWYPKNLTWWGWQRHIAMRRPSISSTFPSRSWSCSSSHRTCLDSNEDMKMLRWNKSGQPVDIINLSELTTCTGCWILFHPNHPNWWISSIKSEQSTKPVEPGHALCLCFFEVRSSWEHFLVGTNESNCRGHDLPQRIWGFLINEMPPKSKREFNQSLCISLYVIVCKFIYIYILPHTEYRVIEYMCTHMCRPAEKSAKQKTTHTHTHTYTHIYIYTYIHNFKTPT